MAIYNLNVGARSFGGLAKFNYNSREGKFSHGEKSEELVYKKSFNLPEFAKDNPSYFWKCADEFEGVGRNIYRKIEFSLPFELSNEDNIKIAETFSNKLLGEDYVYSLAIHSKKSNEKDVDNIHCHLIFNERKLDGVERDEELFFKRANTKNPSFGGTKKIDWSKKQKLYYIRELWEEILNSELEKNGIAKVSSKSLVTQKEEAAKENNYIKVDLLNRDPVQLNSKLYRKKEDKKYLSENEIETIKEWENNKLIKEIKENLYKVRVKEFEHYNEILEGLYIAEEPERLENLEALNELTEHLILVEDIKVKIDKIKNNLEETVLAELARQSFSHGKYREVKKEFDTLMKVKNKVNDDLIFNSMSESKSLNKAKEFLENIEKNKGTLDKIKIVMKSKYLEMLDENQGYLTRLVKENLSQEDYNLFDRRDRIFARKAVFKELKDNLVSEKIIKEKVDLKSKELNDEIILREIADEKYLILIKENHKRQDMIFKLKLELKKEIYGDTPKRIELRNSILDLENKFVETEDILRIYKENSLDFRSLKELKISEFKELRKEQDDNKGRINLCYKKLKLLKLEEGEKNKKITHILPKKYLKNSSVKNFNKGHLRLRTREDEEKERE